MRPRAICPSLTDVHAGPARRRASATLRYRLPIAVGIASRPACMAPRDRSSRVTVRATDRPSRRSSISLVAGGIVPLRQQHDAVRIESLVLQRIDPAELGILLHIDIHDRYVSHSLLF